MKISLFKCERLGKTEEKICLKEDFIQIRVRQLIQEAVDARAEMMKLQIALKQHGQSKGQTQVKDAEVMTETADDNILYSLMPSPTPYSFPPSLQVSTSCIVVFNLIQYLYR